MKKNLKSIDLNLISEFILSLTILLMGVLVMIFKSFGLIEIVLYISLLFYIFALFSTICYFIGRKEGDYELLLLAFINIITATFMFILKEDNPAMILGAGMTVFTILLIANRGIKILKLKKEDNFMWVIKFVMTFLIGLVGMLTTFNLFNNVTVQTMMFGFYFISLGFLLGIESLINIFITNDTFKKILSKIIEEDRTNLEEIKEELTENKKANEITTETKTEKPVKKMRTVKPIATKKVNKTKTEKKVTPKVEPKKVGRPKKEVKEEVKTIRKPGRPKKIETK